METEDRIRKLAKWYYNRLHQDTRTNGDKFYKFVAKVGEDGKEDESLPEHEEEHCRKLALAAHGGMFPDDYRYEFIDEALSAIVDASDLAEIEVEADVYNSDLLQWLASSGNRPGYCDEAVSDGLCAENADMMARVSAGQYVEKREVLALLLSHLREEAEAEEKNEEDEK